MADFSEKKIALSSINRGKRYENGDIVDAEAINAPIEASAYAQKIAEEALAYTVEKYSPLSAYPVGSVYISTKSTNPASIFGGTWVQIQDRFLLAAGSSYSAGTSGGNSSVEIDYNNLPANTNITVENKKGLSVTVRGAERNDVTVAKGSTAVLEVQDAIKLGGSYTKTKISIMPPYLAVYMWRRTA